MALWTYFVDNLEGISFFTGTIVAGLGLFALLYVSILWKRIAPYYHEFWAKLAVAFFRFVAAMSGVAAKSVSPKPETLLSEQPWVLTTLVAIVGYLVWEVVGALGDSKFKLGKEKTIEQYKQEIDALAQDKEDAVEQYLRLGRIVSHLRTLVSEKFQRIRRILLTSNTTRSSLPEARAALAPIDQISMILEKLASLLHLEAVAAGGPHNQNFRIGLYAEDQGHLVPLDAFDLNSRRHDPFSSYQHHADRFRLDNEHNPSHAVRSVREGRMLIVPDCANHPVFQFFNIRQHNYLKSLVAYPLFDFSPNGDEPVRATLLIDTDVADYFQEENAEMMRICLNEFAVRIALEYAIKSLTS